MNKPTNNNDKSRKAFYKANYDKYNSTFRQRIVFAHTEKDLIGYSGKVSMSERTDKISGLCNWILRMLTSGYLDRHNPKKDEIECIEYYANQTDDLIFKLTYDCCIWEPHMLTNKDNVRLVHFIEKFYDLISRGLTAEEIYNKLYYKNRNRKPDYLALDEPRFSNERELTRYCISILSYKKSTPGEVAKFMGAYRDKYFSKQPRDTDPLTLQLAEQFSRMTKPLKA